MGRERRLGGEGDKGGDWVARDLELQDALVTVIE